MSNMFEDEKKENALNAQQLDEVTGGATRGMVPDYSRVVPEIPSKKSGREEANSTPIRPGIFK